MTRIAVFADVHGNLPALEAVLADIDRQEVDEVLVGGDLVGRGPLGSEVVRRIAERGWQSVRGNHEDYLLEFRHRRVPAEWLDDEEWSASRWMAAELDEASVSYIESLSLAVTAATSPEVRLVHGTPETNSHGLGPWSSDAEIEGLLASIDETVLVCAHTHRPFVRRLPRGLAVNVGSVGLPFNGDPRAQYAVLEGADGEWRVEPRQLEYDRQRAYEIYESSGFLAAGGITARLLLLELEEAVPLLVPFLSWAKVEGVRLEVSQLDAFLEFHRPGDSLRTFFRRLDRRKLDRERAAAEEGPVRGPASEVAGRE